MNETEALARGEKVTKWWSVTRNKAPSDGDKFYLIKLGNHGRGIIAAGTIASTPEEKPHYDEELAKQGKNLNFVQIQLENIVDSGRRPGIADGELRQLNEKVGVDQHWHAENSGIRIKDELVPFLDRLWQQKIGETVNVTEKDYLAAAEELDKNRKSLQRVEQGFLRSQLFGTANFSTCSVCGERMPIQFLVAAHVKKRSECSLEEKKDFKNNIVSMCRFGCDELYERGYISVKNGVVVDLSVGPLLEKVSKYVRSVVGNNCPSYTSTSAKYFDWHYQNNGANEIVGSDA